MEFQIRIASLPGVDHKRVGKNNQDSFYYDKVTVDNVNYLFGIICDGCSAGARSETGAHLMVSYIASEIPMMLQVGVSMEEIPRALFSRCIGYLSAISTMTSMGDPIKRINFIINHLLCTIIGFIMDDERIIFFSAGDGVLVINDQFIQIDQDNKPRYLGYHLVDRKYLTEKEGIVPDAFVVQTHQMSSIDHFAVCSDGMLPEAVGALWGHTEDKLGVQRALKVLALRKLIFKDDCTAITVEKILVSDCDAGSSVEQKGESDGS
ncbi:MAG: protein phosphatase 2C domain-containing protein [Candidatus Moraniibacteriota bacterium]